jgi:RNAse (barnase) inhibitor barstar
MRDLNLDTSPGKDVDDFYNAFFKAVGAQEWHGRNFDALNDSIAHGRINEIEVPYRIVIRNIPSRNDEIGLLLRDSKT